MEIKKHQVSSLYQVALSFLILTAIGAAAFAAGVLWSSHAQAADTGSDNSITAPVPPSPTNSKKKNTRIVYPAKTELDFEGAQIEGELRNPGEFYFQHRNEEKFDSLVKRRKDFHREMLRDVVLSK